MAKSTGDKTGDANKSGKGSKGLGGATDKLTELAQNPLARSMLAAGLVTAAAALTANQKVRKGAKKAGREALDGAEAAADNASKVGAAILSAATEAVRRFMAGASRAPAGDEASSDGGKSSSKPSPAGKGTAKPKATSKAKPASSSKAANAKAADGAAKSSAKPAASAQPKSRSSSASKGAAGKGGGKSGGRSSASKG